MYILNLKNIVLILKIRGINLYFLRFSFEYVDKNMKSKKRENFVYRNYFEN